jgi:hypothetical protein
MNERAEENSWGPYEKPRLERVDLVPEEAVLAFCKGKGTQGPLVGSCRTAGGPEPCYDVGT